MIRYVRFASPTLARLFVLAAPFLATIGCSSDPASSAPGAGDTSRAIPGATGTASPEAPASPDAGAPLPLVDGGAQPDAGPATDAGAPDASATIPTPPGWRFVWSDEFNGADGTPIDATRWNQETGGNGWNTNQERQYYTAGTENAVVRGGSLVITATRQGAAKYSCGYGACTYTSARFNTSGKLEQAYGRFEARIQITRGQGMWPAWWMLGKDISSAGWPQCGEIDIMENIGKEPATNHGSMHGPGYSGGNPLTGATSLASGALADDFHLYAIEWEKNVVRFYVDGALYETRTPADVPAGHSWVYDHPFFLILNVAVGGTFPGDPDATTPSPQSMKVDYVRVYSR